MFLFQLSDRHAEKKILSQEYKKFVSSDWPVNHDIGNVIAKWPFTSISYSIRHLPIPRFDRSKNSAV